MESGGMIRCTQCGYKNSPVYHYCGVCGAVLQAAPKETEPVPAKPVAVAPAPVVVSAPPPPPPPAPARTERADLPVSGGMSFLGLSESPISSSSSYLLAEEDEGERSVAWGRILMVLILLGAAGGLGWQWYRGEYPFAPRTQGPAAAAPAPVATPAPADSSSTASAPPAPTTPASENTAAPDANKTDSTATPAPAATDTTPPVATKSEAPAETKPAAPAAAEKTEPAPEKKPPVEKTEKVAPAARVKPPAPAAEEVAAPGEALYVQGQRYLYGTNGVSPNCDLALKSLLSAASRANPKAQSTLGAMYSTGHCVGRDLPTAYRWFAKALHQDPNNSRLEEDLSVVWRQMTPGEQQLATKSQ